MAPFNRPFIYKYSHQGSVLVIGLVVLLVLTILGVSTMTSSSLELRMSGNALQKTASFENAEDMRVLAETAVNAMVDEIEDNGKTPAQAATDVGLVKGFYDLTAGGGSPPSVDTLAFWNDSNNYMPVGGTGAGYAVEYLGTHAVYLDRSAAISGTPDTLMHIFRLTTVGRGADGAHTALQAVYMRR